MNDDMDTQNDRDEFSELKRAHVQLNWQNLKRAMEKRLEKRDKKFLDHDIVEGVGPWGKVSGS